MVLPLVATALPLDFHGAAKLYALQSDHAFDTDVARMPSIFFDVVAAFPSLKTTEP